MAPILSDNSETSNSKERGEQIQRLVYRILPYWPFVVILLVLGIVGANIYLRYQVPVYLASARMVVNDDSQQKSTNLQEIMRIEYKSNSAETEREMQVITSSELVKKVVIKLQLNILYIGKGRIKSTEFYNSLPFKLELENPEQIRNTTIGEAKMIGNKIEFNGILYPMDTLVPSPIGNIRWINNRQYTELAPLDKATISIQPINAAIGRIKGALSVAPITKISSIVDLTLTDIIPERAVDILENLIYIYGTSTVDYKSKMYENTQKFLDARLRLVADELNGVEQKQSAYKTKEGIVDLSKEGEFYLDKIKEADSKIAEANIQLDILNETEQYVRGRNSNKNPIPASLGLTDPVLTDLLGQLYQTEFTLEASRQVSGPKNPQNQVYEDQVNKLKPSILTSINNLRNNLLVGRQRFQDDNARLNGSLNKIPVKERTLIDISREQGIKSAIYTFLLQKREESAIAAAAIVPNYRVLEKPGSHGIISPIPKRTYALGIITALFICILFIFLFEFTNQTVLFRSQIENLLGLPVLAELVFAAHHQYSPVVVAHGKRSLIAEQFRELRTNLNYITTNAKDKCKVILITSSIPKEGKSFVAINTSISLSLTGDKVILLECDLRKPKVSKALGLENTIGISNYIIGKEDERQIIKAVPGIENLSLISSGPVPPNPAELLGNAKFFELIASLKQQFDYIIIDSPPVAAVTDAKIIGTIADATIYIIRHNYTNTSFLSLIADISKKASLPNMNIALNGIVNKKILGKSYGYSYGYGYGYGYGYTDDKQGNKFLRKIKKRLFNK
ncbi:polysaccharide biosynthesis tyrosine autokinase [Ferruginibacter paludis]|uniref:GumC family protein n=1 Tax=Ferruginibacter paludis TaxID=1310417 RepID=UPI0025B34DB6|nr:tyrosine-protein kinase [Ferruginibacter paludis]MDN3658912.1 polysaccharide biosynthesis tyrosine autokinase [Ferruginibacter paludis]